MSKTLDNYFEIIHELNRIPDSYDWPINFIEGENIECREMEEKYGKVYFDYRVPDNIELPNYHYKSKDHIEWESIHGLKLQKISMNCADVFYGITHIGIDLLEFDGDIIDYKMKRRKIKDGSMFYPNDYILLYGDFQGCGHYSEYYQNINKDSNNFQKIIILQNNHFGFTSKQEIIFTDLTFDELVNQYNTRVKYMLDKENITIGNNQDFLEFIYSPRISLSWLLLNSTSNIINNKPYINPT